jgi:hypothetical protein
VAIIAAAAVTIFFFYFRLTRGRKGRSQFDPQQSNSITPESDRYYPHMHGEELAQIGGAPKKVYGSPTVPVRSELDGTEQQDTPLMELEANDTESRPLRPSGENLPQRMES